ncbi:MAG: penicillin-binding protein 1A [Brevinema sp.]
MSLKSWQIKLFIILGVLALGTGIGMTKLVIAFNDLQDVSQLDAYSHFSVPSKIYDVKGRLISEFFLEKRSIVAFNDLPQNLIRAIVATEDNKFYSHNGANFTAMVQGTLIDPLRGRRARGGSGLTQQLAKLLFTDSSRSIKRKVIELWYAFQIEKKYSKEEILELYFNLIYFGHGQYGIQSASQFYFDKQAKDLSLAEASFLAGLPQAPSGYSPINDYKRAQARHRVVLNSMVKEGYISQDLANETFEDFWLNYDSSFIAATRNITDDKNPAPFFAEYVRQQVLERYGEDLLYSGGLQIYTTLDLDFQKVANLEMEKALSNEQALYSENNIRSHRYLNENYIDILDLIGTSFGMDSFTFSDNRTKETVKNMVASDQDLMLLASQMLGTSTASEEIEKLYNVERLVDRKIDNVEGALISLDPETGYVQAMVGGRHFNVANQFNRSTQARRQMGSTFKAIIFAMALDAKIITPSEIFVDEIISYRLPNGTTWTPRNYNGTYSGAMTVRRALTLSINIVTIKVWEKLLKQIGYQNMLQKLALFLGEKDHKVLERRFHNQIATALGTGIATPMSVAQAYSVFINGGKTVDPISILYVYDRNGKMIDDFKTPHLAKQRQQVISPATAKLMQSILNDVIIRGTGRPAAVRAGFKGFAMTGAKSGTSANWTDAWFAGFTDKTSTVVWVGLDRAGKSLGRGRASALVSAPPWMNYMNKINDISKPKELPFRVNKSGLQAAFVSPYTGLLTSASDPDGYVEYFVPGTAPQTYGNPKLVNQIQAQLTQQTSYEVSGQSVDLRSVQSEEMTTRPNDPYLLEETVSSEDLDLSFDLSEGL